MNDKELLDKVRQAFKERKTKDLPKEELIKWLKDSGLTQEETEKAIHTAIKQKKIRFCYPSSVGGKELVPCYERITPRDKFPPEVEEEMWKSIIRQDPRILLSTKRKKQGTHDRGEDEEHRRVRGTGYIEDEFICIRFESKDKTELGKMRESINRMAQEKATIEDKDENHFQVRIHKKNRKTAISILKHAGDDTKVNAEIVAERRVLDHLGFKKWWLQH